MSTDPWALQDARRTALADAGAVPPPMAAADPLTAIVLEDVVDRLRAHPSLVRALRAAATPRAAHLLIGVGCVAAIITEIGGGNTAALIDEIGRDPTPNTAALALARASVARAVPPAFAQRVQRANTLTDLDEIAATAAAYRYAARLDAGEANLALQAAGPNASAEQLLAGVTESREGLRNTRVIASGVAITLLVLVLRGCVLGWLGQAFTTETPPRDWWGRGVLAADLLAGPLPDPSTAVRNLSLAAGWLVAEFVGLWWVTTAITRQGCTSGGRWVGWGVFAGWCVTTVVILLALLSRLGPFVSPPTG